ncbi:MAG: hypothetical protein H6515_14730 [Microthrixaceae bacterium]|jgi:hypothetical protein|nr:hypothetical protein [Microthrixaceae bacterium]
MNAQEAAVLCRYVKACCPQQAIDDYTADAWADLLHDIRFNDARDAVRAVVARQPFIAPSEIRAEVARIRARRITEHPPLTPPPGLSDTDERAWLGDARRRIGDGETIDCDSAYPGLQKRDITALVAAATGPTL